MLCIEDFFGGLDVANFLGTLFPGHGEQPVDVIAADGGFGGHGRHEFQAFEFGDGLFLDVFRHAGRFNLFLQFFDFVLFAAAEFLLDGLEFFVEVILFLGALHLALHAGVDVAVDVEFLELNFKDVGDAIEALERVERFRAGPAFRRQGAEGLPR